MKALAWSKSANKLDLIEIAEPQITSSDEVKLKVLEVGICATDREEVSFQSGIPPEGEDSLILGHEMVGRVVEVGELVSHVRPGDLAIFTVRRSCGECPACDKDAYDVCYTEHFLERGIKGMHGFQSEYCVDHQKYLVKVPESLISSAVLCEPTSVVEKAIDITIKTQQARLVNWKEENCLEGKRVLVAGIGTIGLLAAMIFSLRGAQVFGYDIVDPSSLRPSLLKTMGGQYICAKDVAAKEIASITRHIDLIFEAVGNVDLMFDLIPNLGASGAYVFTGVPDKHKSLTCSGGKIMHDLVLKNQAFIGSVNAHITHWTHAIRDLEMAQKKWKGLPAALITSRSSPENFGKVFFSRPENEIKSVIHWSS